MVRHFVLLETGANQAFVFASNKQAVNVGASELILRAGSEWPREAAREVTGGVQDCVVVAASGKAVLVVDSVEAGRAVIRAVTARALRDAPGLEVWGVVDEEPVGEDPRAYGPALKRVVRGSSPLAGSPLTCDDASASDHGRDRVAWFVA